MLTKISIAEHLLNSTYPTLKDPKILLSVLQNVMDAIDEGISTALKKARLTQDIPPYSDTFNGRLNAFKMHLARQREITSLDFMMIGELQEILREHESSSMEFRRKNAFVIADENYALKMITPEKTKTYIQRTKSFLSRL